MKKFFIFSVVFALLGAEAPKWFSNPINNPQKFYGLGRDSSVELAKKKAINDLVNSLRVSVKSTFQHTKTRQDKKLSSSVSQNINLQSDIADIANIIPSNVECIEGDQCYVRVEIEKANLLDQFKKRVERKRDEFFAIQSPFAYQYKHEVYEKMLDDYDLYLALGGETLQIPSFDDEISFNLVFDYKEDCSKLFKSVLEKTIGDYLTKIGKISTSSPWKIVVDVFREDNAVTLDMSVYYQDEVVHNASVYDTQKPNVSNSFFAKRLGVQAYKKMQKWGRSKNSK